MLVITENTVFSNMMPCSLIEVYRRFGGTYCLHLKSREVSRARNAVCCLFASLSLRLSEWRQCSLLQDCTTPHVIGLSVGRFSWHLTGYRVKNVMYRTRSFVTMFARTGNFTVSKDSWIKQSHTLFLLRLVLILSSHLNFEFLPCCFTLYKYNHNKSLIDFYVCDYHFTDLY
jgi:hypothetical protein